MKKILSFASLLAAAVMLISCLEDNKEDKPTTATGITLKCDKDVIKCDGNDVATLTVITDGGDIVKEDVTFFDGDMNEISVTDFKFTTSKEGTYTIWANYKTFNSKQITIKAINADIPSVAADPKPGSTSFAKKVFISQFTGTGCGYCPSMNYIMNNAFTKGGMHDMIVIAASHSFNDNDPAFISAPKAGHFGGTGYPYLAIDMSQGFADYTSADKLLEIISKRYAETAKAGISANPVFAKKVLPGTNGNLEDYLIVRVAVKAAEAGEYTVGTWLLEDSIYGKQDDYLGIKKLDNEHDYDTHDNCLRVADSKNGNSWIGYDLGHMKEGETAVKTFLLRVKNGWKLENMHMAIFVCAKNENGKYSVNNVIDCPVDTVTPFAYK
jgi:hypothetical protein